MNTKLSLGLLFFVIELSFGAVGFLAKFTHLSDNVALLGLLGMTLSAYMSYRYFLSYTTVRQEARRGSS